MRKPIPSMEGLTTERLIFRHTSLDDLSWWMGYINSAEAVRFMSLTVGSEASCREFIQRSLDRRAQDGSGLNAIMARASGEPLGMIGLLTQVVDGVDELEIGYHLIPSAWGKGYATEAAVACKEFARKHQCATSVISLIDHENSASQAVAKRNGMTYEKDTVHRGTPAMVWRYRFD
ncbi:MAG: GNAT family N-acetyltransferase [Flavobacteriales bacterium]|nr:GNAT family N-acetyltransferase [Flavobacteriales bacterium]